MATTTEKTVRVSGIRVQNILGLREFEVKPGQITLIEGANGQGKTSLLEAIRAGFTGGHDASLLRQGCEYGEIVIVLDDGKEIIKEITPDKTTVKLSHPDFGELKKPRSIIDQLCDVFALNPIDFLLAPKNTRLQLLLAAIPLKVNERDLAGIMPLLSIQPNTSGHALQVISVCEKDLYDQRTGVNRVVKEKQTTAKELKKALPEGGDESTVEKLRDAKANQSTFLSEVNFKARKINEDTDAEKQRIRDLASHDVEKLKAERDEKIELIRRDYQRHIDITQADMSKRIDDLVGANSVSHQMLAEESRTRTTELAEEVADAEAAIEAYRRAKSAREHLQTLLTDAAKFEKQSEELTEALKDLEGIREAMLEDLPIKGLSIENGEIVVDGIQFDRLNESRRVRLAIEVAMLRAKDLRLLCVDGIERLDSQSLAALEQHAKECGIQLILARVTDGAFEVKNIA
jgi:DNA repair exonuclease SbcCD ATPase subunit